MFGWQAALITFLIIWHFMGNFYSVYVHRGKGHNYFVFHPALEHLFRFWIWFTMAFSWPNWMQHYAAKHRKHHRYSDGPKDPHSPHHYTFAQMFDVSHSDPNRANYISPEEVQEYASDVVSTNDWIERNLYCKYPRLGLQLMWLLQTIFFGWIGFVIGAGLYFGAKYIGIFFGNYIIHKVGFTYAGNVGTDRSRVLFPVSIFFGGEEIHAHHHIDASKPWFSRRWWEFDSGWMYCRIFIALKLMRLR